jgi:hypothetical protein
MVYDLRETLEADTSLANVSVEESDTNDNVGELTELCYLLWGGQGDKGSEAGTWQDTLQCRSYLALNGI